MSLMGFRDENRRGSESYPLVYMPTLEKQFSNNNGRTRENKTYTTDNGEMLRERIRIERNPSSGNLCVLGKGGYGIAFQARLLFISPREGKTEKRVVIKIPNFLIEQKYLRVSMDGKIEIDNTKTIVKDKKLDDFYKEINTLMILRKGKAFLPITEPNRSIRNSFLANAISEERELVHTHIGHEFIHRILDLNESIMPCLISEYCNGDLLKLNSILSSNGLLSSINYFTENVVKHWALKAVYEIYHGISYMHSMDIAHNDIKPDNIFFIVQNTNPLIITYRISDFGFCTTDGNKPLEKPMGTKLYMSPELFNMYQNHDTKNAVYPFGNDAYSMALTCLELLFMNNTISDINHSTYSVLKYVNDTKQNHGEYKMVFGNSFHRSVSGQLFELLLKVCILQSSNERIQTFDSDILLFFQTQYNGDEC